MLSTVKVSNVSLKAAQRDIKEFFSFSGDIVHVEMQRLVPYMWCLFFTLCYDMINYLVLCSFDELSQVAYITFKDKQGAETAMLLTVFLFYLIWKCWRLHNFVYFHGLKICWLYYPESMVCIFFILIG
jgi:hypothetical protein